MFPSPSELLAGLAGRVRAARLAADLTQDGLAARAGVSLGSLRRFEATGLISFESLVRLALALGREREIEELFRPPPLASLDDLVAPLQARRRGRRS